ncbi:unnamed protein product [Linum tenue]|uniref:Uncharacterized protein n=1 Tax=Linum tenue TaxID=586396 RepID=A0AAV0JX39_9ROSI|nr:unnamed protein product [Linum tenue]
MPSTLAIGEEQEEKFQHRWTFRRKDDNELDTSSNESSSSDDEPSLKQPKRASTLGPANDNNDQDDDGEANDVNEIQKKGSRRRATSSIKTKDDAAKNKRKMRAVPAKRGNQQRKKSNDNGNGNAATEQVLLNELKNYMSSLLDDMKATRGNLLTWLKEELQKVIAEEVALELDRRQSKSSQLPQQNGSLEASTQSQYQTLLLSKQFQHQTDFQPQQQKHLPSSEDNTRMQNQRTLQANIQQQQQNHFWPFKIDQSCGVVTPQRSDKNKRPSDAYNYCNLPAENPNDYSMAIVPVSSTEEEGREEGFGLFAKPDSIPEKQPKIVLGISANHSAGEASRRSRKGKRVAEDKQVNCSQAILSLPSSVKDKAGRLEFEPLSFTYNNPSGQATSSTYLTLPSVNNKSHDASENRWLDAALSFNSNVQTRVQGSYLGYFQRLLQPEESSSTRSFTPLGSRDLSYFRDNCMSSPGVGSGFPVGLHQSVNGHLTIQSQLGLGGLPRETNHGVGLRMAEGGIRFSGGSYSTMPGQHIPNNIHGRSMAFQDGFQFQK